jgi:hypothetical protein
VNPLLPVLAAILLTSCIHDDPELNAQLFHNMAQDFSNNGDRPRGLWNNIGAAFMEGMAYAEETKGVECSYNEYYDEEDYEILPYWEGY